MHKGIIVVLAFLTLFLGTYIYSLIEETDNIYTHFKKLRQQNCEFTAHFLSIKQCNELIAYKFKTVFFMSPYIKANENYVFFYQLKMDDAVKLDNWFAQQARQERVNDDEFELFSASWPKKMVHFLPQLKRYCLDKDLSCMGRFWRMHDNYYFQQNSYIVYGNDQKYWNAVQQRDFQCDGNVEIDQQVLKALLPYLFKQKLREFHYLLCWEKQRRLLRITTVMTEAYLR